MQYRPTPPLSAQYQDQKLTIHPSHPPHIHIYQAALEALKEIYEGNGNALPDNTLVLVKDKLSAQEEYKKEVKNVRGATGCPSRRIQLCASYEWPHSSKSTPQPNPKQVMKFAAARQQEVKQQGAAALETSLGFDQKAILETNLDYITKSLGACARFKGRIVGLTGPCPCPN